MKYLILDTCIWLYLAEDLYEGALSQLEKLVYDKKVVLLIPEQVQNEWNNGKADIVRKHVIGSLKGTITNAKSLKGYLDGEEKEILSKLIESVRNKQDEYGVKKANKNISRVEELMGMGLVCLTTPQNKIDATEMGLNKKAPFHKKNSSGDAIIILSTIEYLKNHQIRDAFFITGNKEDFGDEKNPSKLHPDLISLFDSVDLQYSINLKEVFKNVDELIVTDEEVKEVEEINKGIHYSYALEAPNCSVCGKEMKGAFLRSPYGGLTWQWFCPGHAKIDTGDFFD